jgi:hypothetical protein
MTVDCRTPGILATTRLTPSRSLIGRNHLRSDARFVGCRFGIASVPVLTSGFAAVRITLRTNVFDGSDCQQIEQGQPLSAFSQRLVHTIFATVSEPSFALPNSSGWMADEPTDEKGAPMTATLADGTSITVQLAGSGLIGVREGLETGFVVMILVAFLVRSGHRDALKWVALGVGGAVLMVAVIFIGLHYGTVTAELIAGLASLVAVAIVTGMVLWMRTAARTISGDLKVGMASAVAGGPAATSRETAPRPDPSPSRSPTASMTMLDDPGGDAQRLLSGCLPE